MSDNHHTWKRYCHARVLLLGLVVLTFAAGPLRGLGALVSVSPPDGATEVSITSPVVFTFSEPMNTDPSITTFNFLVFPQNLTIQWNANETQATITPVTPWPANMTIQWYIDGETALGDPVMEFGSFTTSRGGSGGGTGTNAVTSFSVGIYHAFNQTNSATPVLDPEMGYTFMPSTVLASNRPATGVSLRTPPPVQTITLDRMLFAPENFFYADFSFSNNLAGLNQAYPAGAYSFTISGTAPLTADVVLQPSTQQPNAPHISNFTAAQAIDAAQPFTLTWDGWAGGTTADYIDLEIGDAYSSPQANEAGALRGTATSVTIPAGRLQPNTNYMARLYFMRLSVTSNSPSAYVTAAQRVTSTDFPVQTLGPTLPRAVLTNATLAADLKFQFQVIAPAGQSLTLEASETLLSNSWSAVYTTNAVAGTTAIVLPRNATGYRFFRMKTNP